MAQTLRLRQEACLLAQRDIRPLLVLEYAEHRPAGTLGPMEAAPDLLDALALGELRLQPGVGLVELGRLSFDRDPHPSQRQVSRDARVSVMRMRRPSISTLPFS